MRQVRTVELEVATVIASHVTATLEKSSCRYTVCGSMRRSDLANVGSIPIICDRTSLNRRSVARALRRRGLSISKLPVSRGATVGRGFLANGLPVYLYDSDDNEWGAATLLHTGNLLFTRLMQQHAASLEYTLNGYGLWLGDDQIAGKDERQIFFALGVSHVAPKYRNFRKGDRLPIIL